jgi:peptidoglycan hydrolase-like protein with peptidoglycan-binding domain
MTFTRLFAAAALAALAALVLAAAPPAARPAKPGVRIYFLRGEQLASVRRPAANAEQVVRALIAGPTPAEVRQGFRTYVPRGTRVLGVSVDGGVATVNLSGRFGAGGDQGTLLARLSQLVRTLTGVQGAKKVWLYLDGETTTARFPGIPTSKPIAYAYLRTPNVGVPEPPAPRLPAPEPAVRILQQRLIELGYLVKGDDDGRFGPATSNAVLAFQKWEGLRRTGLMDDATEAQLDNAERPTPRTRGPLGRRAEVLLDRQVALLINNNQVVRTIAVSSGKPGTPTPPGSYRVYAKFTRWWSVPFREWLPWAIPFVGGIAFHEFQVVPPYPASHGCVRQSYTVARWTYNFASVGMPVRVLAH